jgi:hypothetical protein
MYRYIMKDDVRLNSILRLAMIDFSQVSLVTLFTS